MIKARDPFGFQANVEARNALILKRYEEGLLIKDIAADVGMASNSIVGILRKMGVERPTKAQKRWGGGKDYTTAILDLWAKGLCASQIVERLQCGTAHVNTVLRTSGVRQGQAPRHRYDGIGGIARHYGRRDRGALARIARRA